MQEKLILIDENNFEAYLRITANAYPGFSFFSSEKDKFKEMVLKTQVEEPQLKYYGLLRDHNLIAGCFFHDFRMNFNSTFVNVGGIGMIAVDLIHKKQKVCKNLMTLFHNHYLSKNTFFTALYPFRPDFYKKMGYGFSTKSSEYRLKPANFPACESRNHIKFLDVSDKDAFNRFCRRYFENTHGFFEKTQHEIENIFKNKEINLVGFKKDNEIHAYARFGFINKNKENFVLNDIEIHEFAFETSEALKEMLGFFNTQADQIDRIIIRTQDEFFHHLFADARDDSNRMFPPVYHETNIQGIGLMSRIIHVRNFFAQLSEHNFNNQTVNIKFNIKDSFIEANNNSVIIHFVEGKPCIADINFEVEITLEISDFSSLVIGAIDFKQLLKYGLVSISDERFVGVLNELFRTDAKPICFARF